MKKVISRPIFFIGLASFFSDVASESIYPLLPLFLTSVLGASPAFIGLVEGIAESTASLTKYFFGWLSDKVKKREPFVVAGYFLSNVARPLVGIAMAPWQVLFIRFSDRIGKGLRTAPRDAWLASLTPPEKRATVYGFHRAMDHAGATIGPLVAMMFLWLFPGQYRPLFLWAFVPGLLGVACVFVAKKSKHDIGSEPLRAPFQSMAVLPPLFKKYMGILLIFTLGNSSDAFLLLKLKSSGVDEKFILMLWSALHVVKSASSVYAGRFADRVGKRKTILLGWALYAMVYLSFGLTTSPLAVIGIFLFYGFYFGLTEGVEKALVSNLVVPEMQGTAFGLFNLTVGLAALPASLLFGYLWTQFGMPVAFFTGAGLSVLASMLFFQFVYNARS